MEEFEKVVITDDKFDPESDLMLENLYNQCNAELTLQQSKRDQIIAFYITIASFVIPSVFNLNLTGTATAAAYTLLFALGMLLCRVVVRYRVYKEVYWITSRTIATLMRAKREKINKLFVQKIFADNMRKAMPSVLITKPRKEGVPLKSLKKDTRGFATYRKMSNSAETLLYKLISIMSSVSLFLAAFVFVRPLVLSLFSVTDTVAIYCAVGAGVAAFVISFLLLNFMYCKNLAKVYAYCFDGSRDAFNSSFAKAWFLHSF